MTEESIVVHSCEHHITARMPLFTILYRVASISPGHNGIWQVKSSK